MVHRQCCAQTASPHAKPCRGKAGWRRRTKLRRGAQCMHGGQSCWCCRIPDLLICARRSTKPKRRVQSSPRQTVIKILSRLNQRLLSRASSKRWRCVDRKSWPEMRPEMSHSSGSDASRCLLQEAPSRRMRIGQGPRGDAEESYLTWLK